MRGARVDGRGVRSRLERTYDVVVVGSGPAGAAAGREAARRGASVAIVEEGGWVAPPDASADALSAMARHYRDMGTTVLLGRAPIPFLQGRAVGGTSVVNGAICWRLPRDVHQGWLARDPALVAGLPWDELEEVTDVLEDELGVAPTPPELAGRKGHLMAAGAEALGLAHRPIRRNVRGCQAAGRCLQGCPTGAKQTMDRTLLPAAEGLGAHILSSVRVTRVRLGRGGAVGVDGRAAGGGRVRLRARRAVVLAASAIQTPALLLRSGVGHGPVGRHLQCHPGVSVTGRFAEPVRMWTGATQGHEVTGLRHEGLKFEVLGYGLGVLAGRMAGVGRVLGAALDDMAHHVDWGAAVRAEAEGRVRLVAGRPVVSYQLTAADLRRVRRGIQVLGELLLAAGAQRVHPGVSGWDSVVHDMEHMRTFGTSGPRDPRAYSAAVTHLFGTCRMGSDPARSVVRPDFRHHTVDRLFVADTSVFPSNTGVNPQTATLALATLCGRRVAA